MSAILASLNGEIMPLEEVRVPVTDRGYMFGDGIYEFLRIYEGRIHCAEGHFRRLDRSLAALKIVHAGLGSLRRRVEDLVARSGLAEATVYLQVTRGSAPRAHAFPAEPHPCELIYVQPFHDPYASKRLAGVKVSLQPDIRWGRCDIKSLNLLGNCLAVQAAKEADAHEALLHRAKRHLGYASQRSAYFAWHHAGSDSGPRGFGQNSCASTGFEVGGVVWVRGNVPD